MDRPVRNRKTVDYSKFDNDDEDFTCAAAPPSKKSRVTETKKEKKKPSKKSQKEETVSAHQPHVERLSVNEKLYQRDLKVAVVLSLQHGPSETPAVQASPETGLDKITDIEDDHAGGHKRREAASRAISEQRKLLMDENSEEEEEPDSIAITPIATAPLSTEAKSLPCQKETHVSPEEVGEPLQALSPPASIRKPVWTPPATMLPDGYDFAGPSVPSESELKQK